MQIYADLFLVFNLVLNSAILMITALLTGLKCKAWRILGAAGLGSLYALGGLSDGYAVLYSPFAKLVVSFFIVLAAFRIRSIRLAVAAISCFYIVSFLLGGAVMGWLFFFEPDFFWPGQVSWVSLSWKHVAAGVSVGIFLIAVVYQRLNNIKGKRQMLIPLTIAYNDRQIELTGLIDTGNQLFTVSGRSPVILVEEEALAPLLGDSVRMYLKENPSTLWVTNLGQCPDQEWLSRVEIIPYRAVGIQHILLGFRPDGVKVATSSGRVEGCRVVIGIFSGKMTSDDSYRALLHPVVIQFVNQKEETEICA